MQIGCEVFPGLEDSDVLETFLEADEVAGLLEELLGIRNG